MEYTEYQGVEVKAFENEVKTRHPLHGYKRPELLVTLPNVSLLALKNPEGASEEVTWVVVCDKCGFNGITGSDPYTYPGPNYKPIANQANSLSAHVHGVHHPNRDGRVSNRYTNDQIKSAIRIWLKHKHVGGRNWGQRACDELMRRGIKPYISERWNPSQLGHVVRQYMKLDEFKDLQAAPMIEEEELPTTPGGALKQTWAERQVRANSFAEAIAASEAIARARREQQQQNGAEAEAVAVGDNKAAVAVSVTPSFSEPAPSRTLPLDLGLSQSLAAVLPTPRQEPRTTVKVTSSLVPAKSDFELVSELPDGTVLFRYKGGPVMAGKTIKSIEI